MDGTDATAPGEAVRGAPGRIPSRPRILLVDAHPAVRQGLLLVLEADGFESFGEAASAAEALEAARRDPPDLAVVGLSMARPESVSLVEGLHARRVPVLVCSQQDEPALVRRVLAAGARAYVTKADAPLWIARAVRDVLAGWMLISPGAAEGLDGAGWEGGPERR